MFLFIFQVSHKVCHLLHPSLEFPSLYQYQTLVINEGFSTYFSILKTQEYFNQGDFLIDNLKSYSTNYFNAYNLVKDLIDTDTNSIKKLRAIKPLIDRLVLVDFAKADLHYEIQFKNILVKGFK